MNEYIVPLDEKNINITHFAVSKLFDFEQTKELIALLQRLLYIGFFIFDDKYKECLLSKVEDILSRELDIYCEELKEQKGLIKHFISLLPEIRKLVISDIEAAYKVIRQLIVQWRLLLLILGRLQL